MKKILIVLQNDYPYLAGEPFFETESRFISSTFDCVYVFSINGKKDSTRRKMPHNFISYPLNCLGKKTLFLLKGFFAHDKKFRKNYKKIPYFISSSYLLGKSLYCFNKIKKVLRELPLNSEDQITIYSYWLTLGVIAIKICEFVKKKLKLNNVITISRGHGYDIYSERMPYNFSPFQNDVLNNLDYCFPCSNTGCDYLINKYPFAKNKIMVSKLGTLDFGVLDYDFKLRKSFITVAGARPEKRISLIVKTLAKLKTKTKEFVWFFVGDGIEMEPIKKIINENELNDNCVLLGRLSNVETIELYKKINPFYFINSSISEGIPVSIMESISFGVPVIATDVGGTHEIVNPSNGLLVSKDVSPDEFADILFSALNEDRINYLEKRKKARDFWAKNYCADVNYKEWSDVISKRS